jgi:hypothetical protein
MDTHREPGKRFCSVRRLRARHSTWRKPSDNPEIRNRHSKLEINTAGKLDNLEIRLASRGVSYREPLAVRDSLNCRRLIESDWYQQRWGNRFQLRDDQN